MKRMASALILAIFAIGLFSGCDARDQEGSAERVRVVLSVTPWPGSAALYLAREKGYFAEEGVEVVLQPCASGHLGLDAVLSGRADLVTVGDTPLARAGVQGRPVAVLATLCEINRAIWIVARKDRGIASPEDLRGKTLGVVKGTTADFFLHIFLTISYVHPRETTVVGLDTGKVVDSLLQGKVDAISTWFPHTVEATRRLGERAVVFDDPSIYKMTWNIVSRPQYAEDHPEPIRRVLRAVIRANAFIRTHPVEARRLVSGVAGLDGHALEPAWEEYSFMAALDQDLLLNLEDQARWMLRKEDGASPPDFMRLLHPRILKEVEPNAIGIVTRRDRP